MWPRFGIKIGNSTFCIAHVKPSDTWPNVIANKQGDRVSQACLLWDGGNEIECGLTAQQKMATRPKQAVANCFQFLKSSEELTDDFLSIACKTIPCNYDKVKHTFKLNANKSSNNDEDIETVKEMSPFEVLVKLFECELELAKQYCSDASEKPVIVLSVPSYSSTRTRSLVVEAAEKAGFQVAQAVEEPTAAILAYGIGEESCNDDDTRRGLYTKLDCFGPFAIGGEQITEELVKFICEDFQRKYKLDPNESRRSLAKIRTAAANCKHILTTLPSTQLYIDSLMDGIDFNAQMSRARFESLIQPVITNFMQTLADAVQKMQQNFPQAKKIDAVVLLGATTQVPKLLSAISARFPDAEIHNSLAADEIVAVGCARQTLFLQNPDNQILEAFEECLCVAEEVVIWHGNSKDEINSQKLLNPGDILPKTVILNIKLKESCSDSDVFQLRAGTQIKEVNIEKAASSIPEEEFVRLEAEIPKVINNSPVIRLRCI
uniref:Heat shock 70 kDa protein 14 n=1 Tax=Glossina palpalis gambiensis TaxID=67801 RepID=A0A1B0BNX3_9MUSC